jgi:hypothetical protein
MREWASADAGLVADLTDIVEKEFPRNHAAGRQKAAYLLDPTLPFGAPDGTVCRDYAELSAWLEGDPRRPKGLADPAHPLWLYLTTRLENELREACRARRRRAGGNRGHGGHPPPSGARRRRSRRDSDGTIVTEISVFLMVEDPCGECLQKLPDPADRSRSARHPPAGTSERAGSPPLDKDSRHLVTAPPSIRSALHAGAG